MSALEGMAALGINVSGSVAGRSAPGRVHRPIPQRLPAGSELRVACREDGWRGGARPRAPTDAQSTDAGWAVQDGRDATLRLSLIHISEPTRQAEISYAVFCLKKKKKKKKTKQKKKKKNKKKKKKKKKKKRKKNKKKKKKKTNKQQNTKKTKK